jgi:hypothetical protein
MDLTTTLSLARPQRRIQTEEEERFNERAERDEGVMYIL